MLKHVHNSPRRSPLTRDVRTLDSASLSSGGDFSPARPARRYDTLSLASGRDYSPLRTELLRLDSGAGFATLRVCRARASQRSDTPSTSSSSLSSCGSLRRSPRSRSTPRRLCRDAGGGGGGGGDGGGGELTLSSRASSYTSLNETLSSIGSASVPDTPTTTLRLYTRCIRADLEYKTLCVKYTTTCRDIVRQLLTKYRLKHRDPNLFIISLEVATRGPGSTVQTVLELDGDACPAQLQACYPRADSRFSVRTRQGGAIKVVDSILMAGSLYKSLMITEQTTVEEVIQLMLNCYDSSDKPAAYSLYEVCRRLSYERKLHEDDCPLMLQQEWTSPSDFSFVLKKRPSFTPRVGREFPIRQSFVRWSRSRQSVKPTEHQRRNVPSPQPPLPTGADSETDSDDDDVFYI